MNRKYDTTSFIEKSRLVHDDFYDYSETVYQGFKKPVRIICPKHGPFEQMARQHMDGRGCPQCAIEKRRETMQVKYGGPTPMQSDILQQKMRDAKIEKYGSIKISNSGRQKDSLEDFIRKSRETHGDKYDYSLVDYCGTREPVKIICPIHGVFEQLPYQHIHGSGCNHPECVKAARVVSRRKNFVVKSKPEKPVLKKPKRQAAEPSHMSCYEEVLLRLYDKFDADDIVQDFPGEILAAFYIKSRQLYLFLPSDGLNLDAIATKFSGRNYIIFQDWKYRDLEIWFALGCPDGPDWLPERDLQPVANRYDITGSALRYSQIAKQYQFRIFYARELALWRENPDFRGVSLQAFIYYNRLQYLHRRPQDLSDMDILRAFTISGVLKSYTVFDISLLSAVVQKYDIKSIYDPCAGWGERMLYCYQNDIEYHGVDINLDLKPGYETLMRDYGMIKQDITFVDSSALVPGHVCDAVLTCPPYGNTEIYSSSGAENLSESEFLAWWHDVVVQACLVNPKYFCFQINQKWRDRMASIVESFGFKYIDAFEYASAKSSHFTRGKNGVDYKKEHETMLVFAR